MILLLMIISASNGKYFLIDTNDNDHDYIADGLEGPCDSYRVPNEVLGKEVACPNKK